MSYIEKLTETQRENLDVRAFELMSKFGTRNLETMQWTFENHQIFNMIQALLNSEEEQIVRLSGFPVLKDHVLIPKELVGRFTKLRYLMSYNDSYFSEPNGELKRITQEMEKAVTRSDDRYAEQRDPTSDQTLLTPVIAAKNAMGERGVPYAQFKEMFPKFLENYDARWQTGTPPTVNNDYDFYIVAVRRGHDPDNVWVFPAAYANNYDGELQDQDGIDFIAHGWFDVGPDRDADPLFVPTLDKGDEVLGWQPMPKYRA